jgi:DNA-binding winged helix-turn-helix (wHTH) protein
VRYFFENYALDTDRRELQRGTGVVPTTPQVFDLLDYLIRNRERVVSKDDLVSAIWKGRIVSDVALTTRLNAARSVIGDSGEEQRLIKTLPRKGFVLLARCMKRIGLPVPSPFQTAALNRQRPRSRSRTSPRSPYWRSRT